MHTVDRPCHYIRTHEKRPTLAEFPLFHSFTFRPPADMAKQSLELTTFARRPSSPGGLSAKDTNPTNHPSMRSLSPLPGGRIVAPASIWQQLDQGLEPRAHPATRVTCLRIASTAILLTRARDTACLAITADMVSTSVRGGAQGARTAQRVRQVSELGPTKQPSAVDSTRQRNTHATTSSVAVLTGGSEYIRQQPGHGQPQGVATHSPLPAHRRVQQRRLQQCASKQEGTKSRSRWLSANNH